MATDGLSLLLKRCLNAREVYTQKYKASIDASVRANVCTRNQQSRFFPHIRPKRISIQTHTRKTSANAKSLCKYYHWKERERERRSTKYNKLWRFRNLQRRPFFASLARSYIIHSVCSSIAVHPLDMRVCSVKMMSRLSSFFLLLCIQSAAAAQNERGIIEQNEMKMKLDNINYGTHFKWTPLWNSLGWQNILRGKRSKKLR